MICHAKFNCPVSVAAAVAAAVAAVVALVLVVLVIHGSIEPRVKCLAIIYCLQTLVLMA